MINEPSTENGECWIKLCSCLNTPGRASRVSAPAWWSQPKQTVSPNKHISAQTQRSDGDLGLSWKAVASWV